MHIFNSEPGLGYRPTSPLGVLWGLTISWYGCKNGSIALHIVDADGIAHFLQQHPGDPPPERQMAVINGHIFDAALRLADFLVHRGP